LHGNYNPQLSQEPISLIWQKKMPNSWPNQQNKLLSTPGIDKITEAVKAIFQTSSQAAARKDMSAPVVPQAQVK